MTDISEETGISQITSFFTNVNEPGVVNLNRLAVGTYFKTTEITAFYLLGGGFYPKEHYSGTGVCTLIFRYPSMETCYIEFNSRVKVYVPTPEEEAELAAYIAQGYFLI